MVAAAENARCPLLDSFQGILLVRFSVIPTPHTKASRFWEGVD